MRSNLIDKNLKRLGQLLAARNRVDQNHWQILDFAADGNRWVRRFDLIAVSDNAGRQRHVGCFTR